jgi:hypothetical protein
VDEYNIEPQNIYNMDEKGFLIEYYLKTAGSFLKKNIGETALYDACKVVIENR